ncbi:MAG TPA: hypothetical protein VNM48_10630 [Chloroflexota bacterium]|nr:hypothetical protein [Chloroflexota bacterium]
MSSTLSDNDVASARPSVPFFTEPYGYDTEHGLLTALRHPHVAIADGFVLIADRTGTAWRCYLDVSGQRVDLLGAVSRRSAERWLIERSVLYERDSDD